MKRSIAAMNQCLCGRWTTCHHHSPCTGKGESSESLCRYHAFLFERRSDSVSAARSAISSSGLSACFIRTGDHYQV
eukprot:1908542-Pleurochrysis_carterae.AAC.3